MQGKIEIPVYSGYCKLCCYHPDNAPKVVVENCHSLQQLKAEIAALVDDYEVQRRREAIAAADKYFHDKYWKPVDDAHYREYQRRAGERKSR